MDDLDELARASEAQKVEVYRKRRPVVYSRTASAASAPRGYSPFRWGIGLFFGLFFGAVVVGIIVFSMLGGGVWLLHLIAHGSTHTSLDGGGGRTTAAQVGPATLTVKSAALSRSDAPQSDDSIPGTPSVQLSVVLDLLNNSKSAKFDCGFGRHNDVTLKDNFGNTYRLLDAQTHGIGFAQSVYPGQNGEMVLAFEPPVAGTEYLDLDIADINMDDPALFVLRIPRSSISDPEKLEGLPRSTVQAEAARAAAADSKAEASAAARRHGAFGNTPLHDAAREGNAGRILELIDLGAEVDATQNNGLTALHFAAWNGHVDAATALLEHGADVNAKTLDGRTPMDYAIEYGGDSMIQLLRIRGGAASK